MERPEDLAHRLVGVADLTFGGWDEQSNAVARGLISRGVRPGDRILLPCSTDAWISYAIAWAGVLKAGAVTVPVSVAGGAVHLARTFVAANAVGLVGPDFAERLGGWAVSVDELTDDSTAPVYVDVSPDDDAEIIYTSGTTGAPKGVVASHANLLYPVLRSTSAQQSTAMHALPPATTVGQGLLIQPLGPSPHATLTVPRFEPISFLRAISEHRPSHVVLVPAMAIALVSAGFSASDRFDVSSVRQVRTTSAPIHPATLEQLSRMFTNARVRNVYSTTECWPRRLATTYDPARPKSLGRPTTGAEVRIVGSDGAEVPRGLPGDVQLRSDAPQRRYDGAEASAGVFLDGGWTRTGDIGLVDQDGYFYLVDRHPDLINTGGLNVSTLDIEATVMDYPGVIEAAVCGVPHPVLTECVMAAVRVSPDVNIEALHDYLRERRGVAAPHRVVVVTDLPRNLLGKIDKRALRTLLTAEAAPDLPETPTEETVAEIWATALDVDTVSASADFLRIGGSSLSAMEVVSQVAERLGRAVRVRDLMDSQSLREFASRVDHAPPAEDDEPAFVVS